MSFAAVSDFLVWLWASLSGPTLESIEVALDFQRAVTPARVNAPVPRDEAMPATRANIARVSISPA